MHNICIKHLTKCLNVLIYVLIIIQHKTGTLFDILSDRINTATSDDVCVHASELMQFLLNAFSSETICSQVTITSLCSKRNNI